MAHAKKATVSWQVSPEDHDYPAAASYLSLIAGPAVVDAVVTAFRGAEASHFKAKDILRAARLDLLPVDNPHVASDLRKIAAGTSLSPVLLVRGDVGAGHPAQIADGYHRVCASYHTDENTDVPVRIVDLIESHTVTAGAGASAPVGGIQEEDAAKTTNAQTSAARATKTKGGRKKATAKKGSTSKTSTTASGARKRA